MELPLPNYFNQPRLVRIAVTRIKTTGERTPLKVFMGLVTLMAASLRFFDVQLDLKVGRRTRRLRNIVPRRPRRVHGALVRAATRSAMSYSFPT